MRSLKKQSDELRQKIRERSLRYGLMQSIKIQDDLSFTIGKHMNKSLMLS